MKPKRICTHPRRAQRQQAAKERQDFYNSLSDSDKAIHRARMKSQWLWKCLEGASNVTICSFQ